MYLIKIIFAPLLVNIAIILFFFLTNFLISSTMTDHLDKLGLGYTIFPIIFFLMPLAPLIIGLYFASRYWKTVKLNQKNIKFLHLCLSFLIWAAIIIILYIMVLKGRFLNFH